jgi:hypothetical protein
MHILTNCIYFWKAHIVNIFWRKFYRHLRWSRRSPVFDGFFHVIKSLIILIASFVRGCIMMLKLHESSQDIWYKNVIFKCKNCVLHLLFHNKSIYYFFKVNTKISTSFRRSMLVSFWIDMTSICTLSMS